MISNKLVMPEHLNPFGNLFGGQMMSWMDKIAAMEAIKHTARNCVTVKVSEIVFEEPVKLGDVVELNTFISKEGKSSLVVHVRANRKNLKTGEEECAAQSYFTFVAINDEGRPDSSWEHKK